MKTYNQLIQHLATNAVNDDRVGGDGRVHHCAIVATIYEVSPDRVIDDVYKKKAQLEEKIYLDFKRGETK